MKKMMLLLAIASMSLGAYAQENTSAEIPTKKHKVVTNGFSDNWFVGVGGDLVANYSDQEVGVSGNPFSITRGSLGFDVHVGKWFSPVIGTRVKVGAAWARAVWVDNRYMNPIYNTVSLAVQPMFNMHNLIAGYKPRVWNSILYVSAGWAHNCEDSGDSPLVGAGWLNTFNVTKRFHINLDIYADWGEPNLDGVNYGGNDFRVGLSVGCGVNLGKVGWDNAPDIDAVMAMNKAQLDALNASLSDQQVENTRLQEMIKEHKCPEAVAQVTEIVASKASVFFSINSSKVASKKDLVNVKELVDYAKANGKTIVVTGYADSKTGSASYNQTLSERRAKTVAKEIAKMGLDESKIEVVAAGGVADLTPISYNRRAIVTIK